MNDIYFKRIMGKPNEIDNLSFKHVLYKLLNKVDIALHAVHCNNMTCKEHMHDIDQYNSVIASCVESASRYIPTTSKLIISVSNNHVKHFKYQSISVTGFG